MTSETLWQTDRPRQAGYYLVTCAPLHQRSIKLEQAQSYCEGIGSSLAWYNPSNGWWRSEPGSGKYYNIGHLVTHWADRPKGATPTAEQLDLLPKRSWAPWWGQSLRDISRALVYGNHEEALGLIEKQLIPMIQKEM